MKNALNFNQACSLRPKRGLNAMLLFFIEKCKKNHFKSIFLLVFQHSIILERQSKVNV